MKKIDYGPGDIVGFTDLQARMAAELADQINASMRWEDLTPKQAVEVLGFLVVMLEGEDDAEIRRES